MATPTPDPRPGAWRRLRSRLAALGVAGPLFAVAIVGPMLGVAALAATSSTWLPHFAGDLASAMRFVAFGVVATAGCLLPTHATSLVAGFLFGPWLGPFVAWLVVLLAASVGFTALRWLVGERVLHAIGSSPRAAVVHRALLGRGFVRAAWLIALLRLSPLLPFAATNLLFAALGVRGLTFVAATIVGITPRAVAVALVGAGLQDLDWQAGGSPAWTIFAVVATVLVLVVVGRAARAALRRELVTAEPGR